MIKKSVSLLAAILIALAVLPFVSLADEDIFKEDYPRIYEGQRWVVLYGAYDGVECFALQELQRMVQSYEPYVLRIGKAPEALADQKEHLILVGTSESNPLIAELVSKKIVTIPDKPESYAIVRLDSPWNPKLKILAIAGRDPNGVLYGVEAFGSHMLAVSANPEKPTRNTLRQAFDGIEDFTLVESPLITNRGIWTWGYVVYDYRRFLDNMARLRLNTLVMWNDRVPLNAREIIDYAHSRGIKIIAGFHWGWGLGKVSIFDSEGRQRIKEMVLDCYEQQYQNLPFDGLYFQTQTEHNETRQKQGESTAVIVARAVNEISSELFLRNPKLKIIFGLHATSIQDAYTDLDVLDPRVSIMWEDAGVIPFNYEPLTKLSGMPTIFDTPQKTIDYSKKLATLRSGASFEMIAKGWCNLDWKNEFEHHGPFLLGERDPRFIHDRLCQRQPMWDSINTLWLKNFRYAVRFYRGILDVHPDEITVLALVEDGMFEARIQPSVALFAETVWNPRAEEDLILERSQSTVLRGCP